MTNITFIRDNDTYMLSVAGHAGYKKSEEEADIVCAAASCLTETLEATLYTLEEKELCTVTINEAGDGSRHYMVESSCDCIEVSQTFDTIMNGFRLLESTFPKNIKIF